MASRNIVLDTNVLISGALKEGSVPAQILMNLLRGEIVLVTCPGIIEEYFEVFSRPKFSKWKFPPLWIDELLANAIQIERNPPPWPIKGPDQDDLIFLSLAFEQGAVLITGNIEDYPQNIRRGTAVLTPREYIHWLDAR